MRSLPNTPSKCSILGLGLFLEERHPDRGAIRAVRCQRPTWRVFTGGYENPFVNARPAPWVPSYGTTNVSHARQEPTARHFASIDTQAGRGGRLGSGVSPSGSKAIDRRLIESESFPHAERVSQPLMMQGSMVRSGLLVAMMNTRRRTTALNRKVSLG